MTKSMVQFTPKPPVQTGASSRRVVLYSHDTFGLGHLRRSRALATALTESGVAGSAIILTGSPIAGRFTFPKAVDHVRLPGVKKLSDGSYVSQVTGMNIDATTDLRVGLIKSTLQQYQPDLLIVDKEPTGFRGELLSSLSMLSRLGKTRIVLGLRDVLDEPKVLAAEWKRKGAVEAVEKFYHETWVYGVKSIYDPTLGLPLSDASRRRMFWTGYLRRKIIDPVRVPNQPFVLVTPGGGGDGQAMVDLVLRAYELDRTLTPNALLVYGPFLSGDARNSFEKRVAALNGRVSTTGFESQIESLFSEAKGVVSRGGYNTFCEVLSFDKRAIIVPRTKPRLEQWIRANRAEEIGLVRNLDEFRDGLTPQSMIAAIRGLPSQRCPSEAGADGLLDGLNVVIERAQRLMSTSISDAAE
jgi:predicted glycosyltransferase